MKGNYLELSDGIFDRINDENRQIYIDFMIKNPFIAKRKFVNVNARGDRVPSVGHHVD